MAAKIDEYGLVLYTRHAEAFTLELFSLSGIGRWLICNAKHCNAISADQKSAKSKYQKRQV